MAEIVATIEQCGHVFLVERFITGLGEIGRNARKIEVDPISLGGGIDAKEVTDPLILDQRRD